MRRYTETPFSILYLLLDVVVSLLSLRFALVLLGANPANAAVRLLYDVTQPMMEPFRDVFQGTVVVGATVEWSTLAAMLAYALMTILLLRFLALLTQIVDDDDAMVHHRQRRRSRQGAVRAA